MYCLRRHSTWWKYIHNAPLNIVKLLNCGFYLRISSHYPTIYVTLNYFVNTSLENTFIDSAQLSIFKQQKKTNMLDYELCNKKVINEIFFTVEGKCLYTICSVWSKTTLITGSVGGTGVDPPSCKTSTFFLRSLALRVPIYRNFQSNGAKWRSLKLWTKIYIIGYYINFSFQSLKLHKLAPFDWKFL